MTNENKEFDGQILHPSMSFQWIDTDRIEQGQLIFPIELKGEKAEKFSALHLILRDLEFASRCLAEANKIGLPDDENTYSKALIFAGVTSYARAFNSSVRGLKLSPDNFQDIWTDADRELHSYLFDLRQKHIAHSINEFERCDAVGVIVTDPNHKRQEGVTGIGITTISVIGLTRARLAQTITHFDATFAYIQSLIDKLRQELHQEMKERLGRGESWTMAPIARFPDPKNVARRRPRQNDKT